MKYSQVLKSIALAAALAAAAPSFAATVTASSTPLQLVVTSSSGTLKLSDDVSNAESSVIGAFGVAGIQISAAAPATLLAGAYPAPDDYAQFAHIRAPIQSVTFDDTTRTVTGVQSLGGLVQTVATANAASRGGNITVQNIRVDLTTKTLFADVSGANGLASSNIAFFNYTSLSGSTTMPTLLAGQSATINTTLSGLTLTAAGKQALVTGLGLRGIGLTTLNNLTDFGTLESSITVTGVAAVPEPSTYALMGLGLAGAAFIARRRNARH